MSISVSSPHNLFNDTPFDPVDYFNAWRTESQIPTLVIQKMENIIDQYYQMKPQKIKRQNEMRTLFKYNKKLVQTIQQFIVHQKKIMERYNALCKLYITSFQKYCTSKSWDVNFNIKPIRSHFEKFSLKDWKFQIEEEKKLQPEPQYSSLLLSTIKNYFLNGQNHLQKLMERISNKYSLSSSQETSMHLQQIKLAIKQLSNATISKDNMFDLLQKRKNIQFQIRQFEEDFDYGFFKNDINFIQEIKDIHSKLFELQPSRLKEYLKNQNQIRRKIKKKSKQYRKELEERVQRIECQNGELKTEYEIQKKKREEAQRQKEKIKTQYEYLQLKSNQNTKKDKNQINNTIVVQDSKNNDNVRSTQNCSIIIRQPPNKKQDLRISQLEAEIDRLKTEITERQLALNKSISRNQLRKDEMIQDLRRKIVCKLEQFGIKQSIEAISVNVLLEKLLEKMSLHANSMSRSDRRSQNIDVVMIQSVAIDGWQPLKSVPNKKQQENLELYPSSYRKDIIQTEHHQNIMLGTPNVNNSEMKNSKQLNSSGKSIKNSKELKGSPELPPSPSNSIEVVSNLVQRTGKQEEERKSIRRTNTLGAIANIDLLSISQKKSMEQDSKNIIENSKQPSDQKISDKNSVLAKSQREMTKMLNKLKEENQRLNEQINRLHQEMSALQQKISEKQKTTPKSFISSFDLDGKWKDTCHLQQIQTVCQSIAKELVKLEGNQFERMVFNVQTAIKTCSDFSKKGHNINQIPILSKNLQDQNLFKSQNIVIHPGKNPREQPFKTKLKASLVTERERSMKLTLQSGEVKLLINMEKSIYFGNKDNQLLFDTNRFVKIAPPKNNIIPEVESKVVDEELQNEELKIQKQEDFIDIVANFQGMSRKRERPRDLSENSLRYSIDQHDDLRSSLKLINPKLLQDTQLILKIQRKIQEIKNNSENANDLYWFYKKYKQAMDALEKSQATLRLFQYRKESCLKKLANDEGLSKYKLEQNIYFLQQRVRELESQLQICKEEYQANMTKDVTDIDRLKEIVLAAMQKQMLKEEK